MLLEKLDKKDKSKKKGSKLPFSNSKEKASRKGSDPEHPLREKNPTNIESESDQLDNSSLKDEAKKNSQPLIRDFIRPTKKEGGKKLPDHFQLWLRIDDYDAVPIKVDPNMTGHELKIFISESEEFEIVGLKLHKMKLFKVVTEPPGIALNPRLVISDQLDNNDEVFLITDAATLGFDKLSSRSPPLSPQQQDSKLNQELLQVRKEINTLRDRLKDNGGDVNHGEPSNIKVEEFTKRLDEMDDNFQKKIVVFDNTVRQLTELTSTLRRVGGIPVVTNELSPEFGGMPGIKGKDLIGHEGPVWNLFHGENHLFSSSSDQTVKVWDLATLKCKHTLRGHEGIVHCVVGYNKDQNAISGSDDRTIKFWDLDTQSCKKTIADDNIPCALRINRGHLFSGSFKYLKVWNVETMQHVATLQGHNHWVRAIAIGNGYCFSGCHNAIKVWDLANYKCVRTMNQSCGSIYSFVVHGHMLYAGTYENTVNIWDMRSYQFVRSLPGHSGAVYTLAVQGNRLFSGSYDNSIRVWDLTTYKCVQRLIGHTSSVEGLATGISAAGQDRLFSASTDNVIKMWRFPDDH